MVPQTQTQDSCSVGPDRSGETKETSAPVQRHEPTTIALDCILGAFWVHLAGVSQRRAMHCIVVDDTAGLGLLQIRSALWLWICKVDGLHRDTQKQKPIVLCAKDAKGREIGRSVKLVSVQPPSIPSSPGTFSSFPLSLFLLNFLHSFLT